MMFALASPVSVSLLPSRIRVFDADERIAVRVAGGAGPGRERNRDRSRTAVACGVVARATVDRIARAAALERIVASAAPEDINAARAGDRIVEIGADRIFDRRSQEDVARRVAAGIAGAGARLIAIAAALAL